MNVVKASKIENCLSGLQGLFPDKPPELSTATEDDQHFQVFLLVFISILVCQLISHTLDQENIPQYNGDTSRDLSLDLYGIEDRYIESPSYIFALDNSDGLARTQAESSSKVNDGQIVVKDIVNPTDSKIKEHKDEETFSRNRLILKIGNEEFDLKNKSDLERWKKRSWKSNKGSKSLPAEFIDPKQKPGEADTIRSASTTSTSSITIVTSAKSKSAGYVENLSLDGSKTGEQARNESFKKARTDINIHDPLRPIPTALEHPTVDKKGKKFKRIFLPGRGWVAAKILESEKKELFGLLSTSKLKQDDEPNISINSSQSVRRIVQ